MTALTKQRHKMVILNADVVGYSRLVSDDFESTTATMEKYRKLVDTRIADGGSNRDSRSEVAS